MNRDDFETLQSNGMRYALSSPSARLHDGISTLPVFSTIGAMNFLKSAMHGDSGTST